ncbi:hypothetical protein B0H11DRAFT_1934430 [Mycena galericulata]|nr:hypothetical protein B0H11DRAFT_1934430 [Mycena galericulata]
MNRGMEIPPGARTKECQKKAIMRWTQKDVAEAKNSSPLHAGPRGPPLVEVRRPTLLSKSSPAKPQAIVYYANGQTLTQRLQRPPLGQVGWRDPLRAGAVAVPLLQCTQLWQGGTLD